MTREEFLEYQFEGYGRAATLWALVWDVDAEWRRHREIQANNARYLAAAAQIRSSRPDLSDEEVDEVIRREHPGIRFDLPASDRRGPFRLFDLRARIERELTAARGGGDEAAAARWREALASLDALLSGLRPKD